MPIRTDDAPLQLAELLTGQKKPPAGTFVRHLPDGTWKTMVRDWAQRVRSYERDELLPLGEKDRQVFIIVQGYVRQDRFPLGTDPNVPTITRFVGAGQLIGETKLIEPTSSVATRCMSKTYVIPWRLRFMHALQRERPQVQYALLRSLEDRNRQDERIYATFAQSPFQRVSALLEHLAGTVGVPDSSGSHTVIDGATQKDLAAALQLGVSTVETAVRTLRYHGVITAGYRKFTVHDRDALHHSATRA